MMAAAPAPRQCRRHPAQLRHRAVETEAGRPVGRPAEPLAPGDCCAVPAGMEHALAGCSADARILEVTSPE